MGTAFRTIALLLGICFGVVGRVAFCQDALATFEAREWLGLDWAPALVTYRVQFEPARARPDAVRLLDVDGKEHSCQLWRVRLHPDGSIASARVSFMAELKKAESYSYRLAAGKPAAAGRELKVSQSDGYLTLDNGAVAIRLPKAGERVFEKPLAFGTDHLKMVKLYGKQAESGIAPGPIQGTPGRRPMGRRQLLLGRKARRGTHGHGLCLRGYGEGAIVR